MSSGTTAFGIAPELMVFYKSCGKKGPFQTNGTDFSFLLNSLLVSSVIAGFICVFVLLMTDIILQLIEWKYGKNV